AGGPCVYSTGERREVPREKGGTSGRHVASATDAGFLLFPGRRPTGPVKLRNEAIGDTNHLKPDPGDEQGVRMPPFPMRKRCGFNSVELLLIFAVVAVLVGLLLPALQKVREAASKSHCTNNLRQIGAGFNRMHAAQGKLPPALGWYPI